MWELSLMCVQELLITMPVDTFRLWVTRQNLSPIPICSMTPHTSAKWLPEITPVIHTVIDYRSDRDWIQCWMKLQSFGCELTKTKARANFCCWLLWVWIAFSVQFSSCFHKLTFPAPCSRLPSFKIHPLHFCSWCYSQYHQHMLAPLLQIKALQEKTT